MAELHRWAESNGIPVVRFAKGESKEATARPFLEAAAQADPKTARVVLLGIAQEKASVWRSWKAKGQEHARRERQETTTSVKG